MTSITPLTPQQRLAISRKAIVRHMQKDERPQREEDGNGDEGDPASHEGGTWQIIKHTLRAWWRHHPAHVALDVAKPMLGHYAEEHPLKLLGIAAGIGAAAIVLRPWRLVSMTGLMLATLKSSQLSGVLLSLLSNKSAAGATTTKDTP